jgi:outer membrane immunogenic protein
MVSSSRLIAALTGLLAATGMALGADLSPAPAPISAPLPAPVPYNWNGIYLGLNAGYASGKDAIAASGGGVSEAASPNLPGFTGGAQFGINYQVGSVVWGFEADFNGSTQNTSVTTADGILSGTTQMPWFATLRGRLGWAFDRVLVYATAGGAGAEFTSNFTVAGNTAPTTVTSGTWTAGGGLELALTDNLSARVEYLYFDTGNVAVGSIAGPTTVTSRLQDNIVRAGLNYRWPVAW